MLDPGRMYRFEEVVGILGVHIVTVRLCMTASVLPAKKVGRLRIVSAKTA